MDWSRNRLCRLLGIEKPIIQGGGLIDDIPTVAEVMARLDAGYREAAQRLGPA